ncbi:SRPBCC family protein [Paenibacillus soyae]|uniref:SRPBCC domain-containing protein n=1 Tax=Paenibacillus soyae TaxID=2969249 RepID=A0A9X2MUG8_9BACL|nr:SRPBCC domain-containing protein [Paenibacillus soyae]MCR2807236.1 SRPBCC domain-containing protein [Paenibacillus soyae]
MNDTAYTELVMVREFKVSPEKLFDAWIDPVMMRKWLMSMEATNKSASSDPRVGGLWEIIDVRGGKEYRAVGRYLEIDRPIKLVFTFQMPQFSEFEDTITVNIKATEEGCKMVFTQHIRVPVEENWTDEDTRRAVEEFHDSSQHGWHYMFVGLKMLAEEGITPVMPPASE